MRTNITSELLTLRYDQHRLRQHHRLDQRPSLHKGQQEPGLGLQPEWESPSMRGNWELTALPRSTWECRLLTTSPRALPSLAQLSVVCVCVHRLDFPPYSHDHLLTCNCFVRTHTPLISLHLCAIQVSKLQGSKSATSQFPVSSCQSTRRQCSMPFLQRGTLFSKYSSKWMTGSKVG